MSNPILSNLGVAPKNNIVDQFREFRTNFTGNPQETLNNLVSSGRVSQQQVEQAKLLAQLVKGVSK